MGFPSFITALPAREFPNTVEDTLFNLIVVGCHLPLAPSCLVMQSLPPNYTPEVMEKLKELETLAGQAEKLLEDL